MTHASVAMVCQFGEPVRGLSPYGDALLMALRNCVEISVTPVDYRSPYPGILHPGGSRATRGNGELHWASPASWLRLARIDANILHLQHWSSPMACYLAPLANMARRNGKRIVITVHNPDPHEALPFTGFFENWLLGKADALIAHDIRGANALRLRNQTWTRRIHVIPHGINVASAPESASENDYIRCGLDRNRRYVCIFGNLRGYKGIDVLLSAWGKVASQIPDVDLVIAGRLWSGSSGLASRMAAKLLGTSDDADRLHHALDRPEVMRRVHLLEGFVTDDIIDSILRLSALAVFPYVRFSSQSGAACRATGMGCPVVVSNVGGLSDLAIGTGWVVTPGDVDGLADMLCQKLSNHTALEAARYAQLQRVKPFDWNMTASKHQSLYLELSETGA